MGKISVKRRQFEIGKKKKKKQKIQKLTKDYLATKTKDKKERILEKIKKISPFYPVSTITKEEKK